MHIPCTTARPEAAPPEAARRRYGRLRAASAVALAAVLWMAAGAAPAAGAGVSLRLAEELFEEGDWAALGVECHRAEAEEGAGARDRIAFLEAMAGVGTAEWGSEAYEAAVERLDGLWRSEGTAPEALRPLAAYETARAAWDGRHADARTAEALEYAFLHLRDPELFSRAACLMHFYLKADDALRGARPDLAMAVEACRDSWPSAVWRESNPRTNGMKRRGRGASAGGVGSWPGRAVVGFYRTAISPALGSRCSLDPSCSEYFLQASRKHGLLGIPMGADRLIREPMVVHGEKRTVERPDGSIRVADPVEEHDSWMEGRFWF